MKKTEFNICPHCKHLENCVLTQHKETVWSCSEFDDTIFLYNKKLINNQSMIEL